MTRRRIVIGAVVLGVVATGGVVVRAQVDGSSPPFRSTVEPLPVVAPVPSYAVGTRRGLVVRHGDDTTLLPDAVDGRWLPSGDLLTLRSSNRGRWELVDAASGAVRRSMTGAEVLADPPGRSASRVNLLARFEQPAVLHPFTAELRRLEPVVLPLTDDPAAADDPDIERVYYGPAVTVGESTFVQWHDSSETYEDGDHGVARIRDGVVDDVLLNERLVALFLSVDGASLLALRQASGEPCGGCVVDQDIVEVDPATGELHDYGHPEEYTDAWRVDAVDKVGDRVAVRYVRVGDGRVPRERNLIGTYVHEDGDWTLLAGSDEAVTWWQDGGRVLARPAREPLYVADGYRLSWVADGSDREVPITGELTASFGRTSYRTGAVAGQLLPPDDDEEIAPEVSASSR
jgi:hypothetical protein